MSDAKFALACSNGTTAIELALKALDVKGKKVLMPSNTFFATSVAITNAGGIIELLDMEPESFSICPIDLEKKLTPAKLKKRNKEAEIIKKKNPKMDKGEAFAIATKHLKEGE